MRMATSRAVRVRRSSSFGTSCRPIARESSSVRKRYGLWTCVSSPGGKTAGFEFERGFVPLDERVPEALNEALRRGDGGHRGTARVLAPPLRGGGAPRP